MSTQKTVSLEVFYDFLLGFINSSPLYRFVDTGRALQSADNKVRAVFVDYVLDNDCEQVYIGGLGDYGYRAELDSLRRLKLVRFFSPRVLSLLLFCSREFLTLSSFTA